ncbi:hypothetical protein HMPREF1565_3841 [Providencia alcalifaciens RIMD 1656011]|uniref:Uncharacterized protein n=2 Tax=Providencia alcalifaciens TaxID=126385 RepID=B6X9W4_9GAMM|nr:hypothetical protein PROVALCAL_00110 [Providencia alcalifaciens DSM 30120]ETT04501.1 hypothetical protein HMPREF1562_3950 [Providencia alcalifaciens F90-2004]EUC96830.1 hypothetical protein HMPREF1567_0379 [Providencia alcalifaciens PAL-2]EUD03534.1 hypothetical protein HMPREF1565_3841 [Providencia alcalifaciens RIMD 1656011]EUD06750.1 hypothetical protein HMPREF1564_3140 [Providencia alcalifaciens R90-1475]EUD11796.1 hypothetical protein HMPREF1563_1190 [Providencia alcalifaciens 205/92]
MGFQLKAHFAICSPREKRFNENQCHLIDSGIDERVVNVNIDKGLLWESMFQSL